MAQKLYSWESTFNFESYEKNIIEDDIIPDEDIINLKNFIESYCSAKYNGYEATGNSGYRIETVDGSGPSDCNGCDTTVNCYPASAGENTCGKPYNAACATNEDGNGCQNFVKN